MVTVVSHSITHPKKPHSHAELSPQQRTSTMKKISISALATCIKACSYQSTYSSLVKHAKYECSKRPPSEYDQCVEKTETSYEEYERSRQEVLNLTH